MKKSIEVYSDYEHDGTWCLRVHKKKGKFTLDEIIDACREYEQGRYVISINAMETAYDDYFMDEPEGDYVTVYSADKFFESLERDKQ